MSAQAAAAEGTLQHTHQLLCSTAICGHSSIRVVFGFMKQCCGSGVLTYDQLICTATQLLGSAGNTTCLGGAFAKGRPLSKLALPAAVVLLALPAWHFMVLIKAVLASLPG